MTHYPTLHHNAHYALNTTLHYTIHTSHYTTKYTVQSRFVWRPSESSIQEERGGWSCRCQHSLVFLQRGNCISLKLELYFCQVRIIFLPVSAVRQGVAGLGVVWWG